MWNIFKHSKNSETSTNKRSEAIFQSENLAGSELENSPTENLAESKLENSPAIDLRLEALVDYFDQCEKNGIEITPAMAENEILNKLGIKVEELLEAEIKDPELKKIHEDIIAEIQKMMAQKATDQKTILSYLRETVFKSNFAKAAFVTAMLFLKFNPAHSADDNKKIPEQKKDKTEQNINKTNALEGDDAKIYVANAEDFNKLDKKVKIEAISYFDTDKADLKNIPALSDEFENFLSSINETNFKKIMDRDWTIKGSSDEQIRPAGNEKLTQARISAFGELFGEILKNHDFSQQLPAEKTEQVLAKKISEIYPTSGQEKGVTYITDLKNQETGEKFTTKEVSALNPIERQVLLDKCRYTNFEISSSMFEISAYGQCIILVDNSPSMENSQKNMADELRYLNENLPVTVGYFSSELSVIEQRSNSQEAATVMSKMPTKGATNERAFSSAIQYLEKVAKSDKEKIDSDHKISKIIYIATDEALQDANRVYELTNLTKANPNIEYTIKFLMFSNNGSKVIKLSLEDLINKVEKIAESGIKAKQEEANKNLIAQTERANNQVEKILQNLNNSDLQNALANVGVKGNKDEIKKQLLEKDYLQLKALESNRLCKNLINAKYELLLATSEVNKANELTVAKQLETKLTINILEDSEKKSVKFPI